MKRRSVPSFKIGIFVAVGFLLLLVFIFAIGSQEQLFNRTSKIHAKFRTVSGLKSGAQVQMAGIAIGSVTDIELPKAPGQPVNVTMKILNRAMPLIRKDSRAVISTEGLIGDKIIMIEEAMGGPTTASMVKEGDYIVGEPPRDYSVMVDTLGQAVDRVNQLTTEATLLLQDIRRGQGSLGKLVTDEALYRDIQALANDSRATMAQARVTLADAQNTISNVGSSANDLVVEVQGVVSNVRNGKGSLGKLINDDSLYREINGTLVNVRQSSYDLRDALAKLSLGAGNFAEVGEALKHNFLVKSYFEERGYWDAPQFELTIDRKIDSLNRLQNRIENLRSKAENNRP